jgi:prophage maintenance system killer protein
LASRDTAALVFLDLNGIEISDPASALYRLMMQVAQGKKNKAEIARFLEGMGRCKERSPQH